LLIRPGLNLTYGIPNMKFKSRFCRKTFYLFIPVLLLFMSATQTIAQLLSVVDSKMTFTSDAELELISASSERVQGLIDPATSELAFSVEVKSFQGFNSALQRDHFNEKYLESEKFPSAYFSGKIIEPIDFSNDRSYDVRAKGELNIHGQKQIRIIKSRITIENGVVYLRCNFFIPLSDHNISIPSIVSQKIATEIEVNFTATMSRQEL
jgi:hypothetical protein